MRADRKTFFRRTDCCNPLEKRESAFEDVVKQLGIRVSDQEISSLLKNWLWQ